MPAQLGRLERLDPRVVWLNEASDFTPWLAMEENLRLIGDAIGLELELEAQEQAVGPFRADMLCRDLDDNWVLVENQLEKTDHCHLGQLLAYAAGLKAVTIVWIARHFREEHRAALDWLNDITHEGVNFFGLEVELWRIGDSLPAPKFNVVSKPNDWRRSMSKTAESLEGGTLSDTRALQLEFWSAFVDYLKENNRKAKIAKPRPKHWIRWGNLGSNTTVNLVASSYSSETQSFSRWELRVEVVCRHISAATFVATLQEERQEIEREVGAPLEWHAPEQTRMKRIYITRGAELEKRERWPEYFAWFADSAERMAAVFKPRVQAFDFDAVTIGEEEQEQTLAEEE